MYEYRISFGNLKGRDHLYVVGKNGRMILKWILRKKKGGVCGMDYFGSRFKLQRDFVNTVIKLQVLLTGGEVSTYNLY
jgi:hypothetical protein